MEAVDRRNSLRRTRRRVTWHQTSETHGGGMREILKTLWEEEEGQDLTEYALLVVLIALAAITSMNTLATRIASVFANAAANITVTTGGGS